MKNFFKKWGYYLVTIMMALVIVVGVYLLQDVAPFGKKSLLTIDFFHQYGPMLGELRDRILSGDSLIYSFRMGMGLPFFRNYFNYMSSPFNILILLFRHKELLMSYSIIIGLKAICSAWTMSIYLEKKVGKSYTFIALSVLYAFSAYFSAYYWNIMWIDGMVMLPLIALGIDKLVKKNNILFYSISLAVMLYINYFIGYMLCIFSVIYFIITMINETNKFGFKSVLRKCLTFAGASLLAGGLCAFFLIPLFLGLREISATGDVFPTGQYYAFTFKEFFFNHFSGVGSTVLKSDITNAPNISIGVISIPLLMLFLINKDIKPKIRFTYILFLIFLVVSFRWGPLDYIWHAFHIPNDLPYRYSFIYSFVLTTICAYSIKNIKNIKPTIVSISYVITLILITLMRLLNFANISSSMLTINYILITIFYLCYILVTYFREWNRWSKVFFLFAVCLECLMVVNNCWGIDHNIESFYEDYDSVKDTLAYIKNQDDDFYRVERLSMLSFNDPSWYGYYGQIAFSSMEYENLAVLQHNLGMPGNEINSFYYRDTTPIYNMMFDIKYIIGDSNDKTRFTELNNDLYKNEYTVGLMFGVKDDIKLWKATYNNPINNLNDYISKSSNTGYAIEKVEPISRNILSQDDLHTIVKYTFPNNGDNYYLYYPDYEGYDFILTNGTLYFDNDEDYKYAEDFELFHIYGYANCLEKYIISEKSEKDNIVVYIGYSYDIDESFGIYRVNTQKLNDAYAEFVNNKIAITEFKEHDIKAKSNFEEDKAVFTSIPYDEGWQVYVDGERVQTYKIGNALLGYDLTKGEHNIELKYQIPHIGLSIAVSLTSLVLLAAWQIIKKD